METKRRLEEVKRWLGKLPVNRDGDRLKYPEALKHAVVELMEKYKNEGGTQVGLADELGLNSAMLSCWKKELKDKPSSEVTFKPVQVRDEKPHQSVGRTAVVLPNGIRIEGLNMNELVTLMRELT